MRNKKKIIRWVFGSNESKRICFRYKLTFTERKSKLHSRPTTYRTYGAHVKYKKDDQLNKCLAVVITPLY